MPVKINKIGFMDLSVLPYWSGNLKNYYVLLRVEGRNKTLRRRYYRKVEAEKLRLAEAGYCQIQITLVCRFLATLNKSCYWRMVDCFVNPSPQLRLDFT